MGAGRGETAEASASDDGSPSACPSNDNDPPLAGRFRDGDDGFAELTDALEDDDRPATSEGAAPATTALGGRGEAGSQAGSIAPAAGGALEVLPAADSGATDDGAPPPTGGGPQLGEGAASAAPPRVCWTQGAAGDAAE